MVTGIQRKPVLLAGAACIALAAHPAGAQQADRTAVLEQRVRQLEEALRDVRQELEATKRQQSQASATQSPTEVAPAAGPVASAVAPVTPPSQTTVAAVPPEEPPTQPKSASSQSAQAQPPGTGFRVGNTTFRLSGFIKADAIVSDYRDGDTATNSLGRDFYLPQFIPVDDAPGEGADFDAHAKQTRIILTTETPVGDKVVAAHIESDFQTSPGTQGSERTTNGYNFALRRAFITYDGWTFGQDWSNFQNVTVLPEAADFVGVTEGTIFVRQMQVRYTHEFSKQFAMAFALENPETSSITPATPVLVENDDDHLPDATLKLTYTPSFGQFTLSGLARQLSVNTPIEKERSFSWGVSAAGRIPFGKDGPYDIRFMLTYGKGIGRYVGFNFAPDVLYLADTAGGGADLERVDVLAGFVAFRIGFTDKLRTNIMGSFQDVDYPTGLAPATANENAHSVAVNLFYSPVKPLDLGIEYRYGRRKLLNGDTGKLNRVHFVAKHAF
ncbi:DcaP family trimeric outer membrane transporter [Pedomonas mirosovicensis]|uniref:DcaP family trimeric outer membrane transporter n=1 Tax=Pedomonas mirosovicensis TaxID=2908641 RepID=UPI002166FCFF|nr:DcaP family trimeric outer membrane transporter [Pedomonas mirosovicensis]MCH8685281.1 DcaP family trimeric outer membrane transporter [Pedomonas mirosovicensis]